ncbi:ribosomal-protein-alanine acetyltransferase [Enterococcus sp. 9E7_DIV0242]|uniref:Ribosomal-protein-alanine acetyltransferase n=2 Tax=Candidatus Enterococcus clewellii TaxID=1834193 RepID=A0A242KDR2_9ENTE|nr:ribosomal-protein-alanine acetyltransferase [Enterococcus sp. 9E7_DIV0242]
MLWEMKTTLKKFDSIRKLFGKKKKWTSYTERSVTIDNDAYVLREITPDDIKDLLSIEREVYEGELPWTRSAFLSELSSKNPHLYILAEKEGQTIGFIGCRVIDFDGHITNVAVAAKGQGKGLGTYLLNEAFEFSESHNCTRVSLEVRLSNKHAQSVYRKAGFISSKITQAYYDDGEDALEMIKLLDDDQ